MVRFAKCDYSISPEAFNQSGSYTEKWHQSSTKKTPKVHPLNTHIPDRSRSKIIPITRRTLVQKRRKFVRFCVHFLHPTRTQRESLQLCKDLKTDIQSRLDDENFSQNVFPKLTEEIEILLKPKV